MSKEIHTEINTHSNLKRKTHDKMETRKKFSEPGVRTKSKANIETRVERKFDHKSEHGVDHKVERKVERKVEHKPKDHNEVKLGSESKIKFEEMDLHPKLLQGIHALKFENPTEIQRNVIPLVIRGGDLMASADTGTGKTMAFVVPMIHSLLTSTFRAPGIGPKILILTPTRELAEQVTDCIRKLSRFTDLRFGSITGGVSYFGQEALLRKPFDILVATPGRLLDHMNQGRVNFSRLEMLVLDEADRMLDMGFMKDIEKILKSLPDKRQILLFSATLEGPVLQVAGRILKKPECVKLASNSKPNALISQIVHQADDSRHKFMLLKHILEQTEVWQAIVFTATKRAAESLSYDLSDRGITCAALHGDMKQSKRSRTLERMHRGQVRVLVATDVAARGLDVKAVSHVINYDIPKASEDYIHRIGRTGRAGETGVAISLVEPKDWRQLMMIERFTGQKLTRTVIPGLEPKSDMDLRSGGFGSNKAHSSRGRHNGRPNVPKKTFGKVKSFGQRQRNRAPADRTY